MMENRYIQTCYKLLIKKTVEKFLDEFCISYLQRNNLIKIKDIPPSSPDTIQYMFEVIYCIVLIRNCF